MKRFTTLFVVLALVLLATTSVFAQNSANYGFSTAATGSLTADMNSNPIDMSTGTTLIVGPGLDASAGTGVTNIGFDFYLMGTRFTQFSVQDDGLMQLGGTVVGTNVYTIAGGTLAAPRLGAFNADFRTGTTTGKIHYKLIGTAPNRTLVVEFKDMQLFFAAAAAGTSTWQVRLYETTGGIEFVYGAMNVTSITAANRAPSIGFYTGAATGSFASVAYATHTSSTTASYSANPLVGATGDITDLNSTSDGSRRYYRYVPPTPTAATVAGTPIDLITGSGMRLNWVDSPDELIYAIYRSTDDIAYSFASTAALNSILSAQSGLLTSTLYYWKIYAVSEGGMSLALGSSGGYSATTLAAAIYTWNQTGSAAYGTAANWTPTRTTPDPTDILSIDGTGTPTPTITGFATETIGQLKLMNSANAILQAGAAATMTLGGNTGADLDIPVGSSLVINGASALTIASAAASGNTATIGGTLEFNNTVGVNALNLTNCIMTIAATGTLAAGGTVTTSPWTVTASTLIVNGTYDHKYLAVYGTIPTATWNAGSTVRMLGFTSPAAGSVPVGINQTFSNFVWDCPSQTTAPNLAGTTITATGTFTMTSTGTSELRLGTGTSGIIAAGNYTQTGGTINCSAGAGNGTVRASGTFNQTGGTITESSTGTGNIEFNGVVSQAVTLSGTMSNTINYRVNNNSGITLTGTVAVTTGASLIISSTAATPITGGTLTYTGTTTLVYNSSTGAQTPTANEFPAASGPTNLTINNTSISPTNVVTLPFARTLPSPGVLTLTAGQLLTTSSNLLTLANTAVGAVSGGSATSYVNGPLERTLPLSLGSGSTYAFPLGKGSFKLVELVNPTTNGGGTVVFRAEVFDANSLGSAGTGILAGSLNTDRYWDVSISSGGANFINTNLRLTEAGLSGGSRIGKSGTVSGAYDDVGGTTVTPTTINAGPISTFSFFVIGKTSTTLSGTIPVGAAFAPYLKLTNVAAALNSSTVTGDVVFELQSDYDGTSGETFPVTFNAFTTSGGTWTATIRPAAAVTARIISGTNTTAIIDLNGVQRLTIDGRPGGVGVAKEFTISNANTGATASTVRLINAASNNTVRNCLINGSSTGAVAAAAGTVLFSTTTSTGNSNNTISTNDIGPVGAALPTKAITGLGTAGNVNATNLIDANNIFDFFSATASVAGIDVAGNNNGWTISNNRIYQSATRTFTGAAGIRYYGIVVNSSGNTFTVSGNVIGFGAANGTGTTTITGTGTGLGNEFRGIAFISSNTVAFSSIQGNTISGINLTTNRATTTTDLSSFIGIQSGSSATDGPANIGNTTGNTIGSLDGTSTIVVNAGATAATAPIQGILDFNFVTGISVSNNSVGSITINNVAGVGTTTGFRGINVAGTTGTTHTVSNNIIGGTAVGSITDNLVGNYAAYGIQLSSVSTNATGNTVRNITANANGGVITVGGILSASSTLADTFSQNTVHSLSDIVVGGSSGAVYGMNLGLPTAANVVERNNIHSLSVTSTLTTYQVWGIATGATGTTTYRNNMIRLGLNAAGASITTGFSVIGIRESAGTNNSYYHNSVFIGGTGVVSASNTYCILSSSTTTRNFKDNALHNARSNASGGIANIAISVAGTVPDPVGLSSDYNDLFADGTDGNTGVYNAAVYPTLSAWQAITGQDTNSIASNPRFILPNDPAATVNLHIDTLATPASALANRGINAGVANDFDGNTRISPPDIGADEFTLSSPAAFSLSSPANGATGQPLSITLSWTASTLAQNYDVLADVFPASPTTVVASGVSGTSTIFAASPTTHYNWSVRAHNGDGNTMAANGPFDFMTISPPAAPTGLDAIPTGPVALERPEILSIRKQMERVQSKEESIQLDLQLQSLLSSESTRGVGNLKLESMASGVSLSWTDNAPDGANSDSGFYVYAKLGSAPVTGGPLSINFKDSVAYSPGTGGTVTYNHTSGPAPGLNEHWFYKVTAKNLQGESNDASADTTTFVKSPGAPTFSDTTWESLKIYVALNGNPGGTEEYAIRSFPSGNYVQANGSIAPGAVWQTYTAWGGAAGKLLPGLARGTTYTFEENARNTAAFPVESGFGPMASAQTNFQQPPAVVTYTARPNLPVPDNITSGIRPVITVPATNGITKVQLRIDSLLSTWIGDFRIKLISPRGDSTVITWLPGADATFGSSADNYINTVFDDAAATTINSIGTTPLTVTGSFRPDSNGVARSMSIFNGNQPAGDWTLYVFDGGSGDTGTLVKWSLIFTLPKTDPNVIIVRKLKDTDGDFSTTGDRTLKSWSLALNKDSLGGALIASGTADSIMAINLLDGTYIASEADSVDWYHLGKVRNGIPVATSTRFDTIVVSGGGITWVTDFVNTDVAPDIGIADVAGASRPGQLIPLKGGVKRPAAALRINPTTRVFSLATNPNFEVNVENFGQAASSYQVGWLLDGSAQTPVNNSDPLGSGDDDTLTITWGSPAVGLHTFRAYTILAGDIDASNDSSDEVTFEVLPANVVFNQGFNAFAFPPTGWASVNADGDVGGITNWLRDFGWPGQEGTAVAADAYTSANGTVIDDWLISPNTGGLLRGPGGALVSAVDNDTLSFLLQDADPGLTFPDTLEVRVSTIDTALGSFTTLLDVIQVPGSLEKFSYLLPNAANRYVAFRYHHADGGPTGGGSNYFMLDDARITRYTILSSFAVNPDSLDFGDVVKNTASTDTVTVTNASGSPLAVDSVRVVGGEFTALPAGPVSVPAAGTMDFYITFNPTASGVQSAYVIFYHDAATSPDSVYVTGTGVQSTFAVAPTSINFGSVDVSTSLTDTVTVTNNGGAPLLVDSVRTYGGEFSVSPNGSFSIAGSGGTKDYYITFSPTGLGAQIGSVKWFSNSKTSPDSVDVGGTGVPAGPSPKFTTVSPDSIAALDIAGKLVKAVKRKKQKYPNWTNLLEEVVAQGGFSPKNGATETDSAGGEVIGISFMFKKAPLDTLKPKWTQIKQTSKSDTAWARLSAWDFKKNKGKSASQISKTMRNKTFNHWTSDLSNGGNGTPRGFDSTLVPGVIKRKQMKKQMTKLDPKKTPNKLYSELVAFKFNIASSQLGNTPAGFGDLVYDADSSLYDEMSLIDISQKADTMMTFWKGVDSTVVGDSTKYAQLYKAVYDINRAFIGVLDTNTFERVDSSAVPPFIRLNVKGNVDLATVPFLKEGALRPTMIRPTSHDTETEEDYEDGDYFEDYETEDGEGTPAVARLYQNYPNPFNPTTTVSFRLLAPALVTLKVYNVLGQEITTLLNGDQMDEGYQTVQFNPSGLSSGVYFYQINVQSEDGELARTLETKKMLLIK